MIAFHSRFCYVYTYINIKLAQYIYVYVRILCRWSLPLRKHAVPVNWPPYCANTRGLPIGSYFVHYLGVSSVTKMKALERESEDNSKAE